MSQEDSKVVVVGDDTYRFYMLEPMLAADTIADIVGIVMPAVGGAQAEVDGWERAMTLFFSKFDKAKQRELIAAFSKTTAVVKSPGLEPQLDTIFSTHFKGRPAAIYKWLGAALRANFGNFFDEIAPGIKAAVAGLKGLSKSPSI